MSEYSTYFNGEYTNVYDLDKCLRAIQCRNADNERRIKNLEEENNRLKDEHYKDETIQIMKSELDKMRRDYWRGFPITEDEEKTIENWKKEHDEKVHGYTKEMRIKAEGISGGRYSYRFIPTAIGTSGVIRCSCGAEFEFQEIG